MPFFLILVVALLFGLTPTAGASEARLSDEGTRLVVEPGATVGIKNDISISSMGPTGDRRIRVEDPGVEGITTVTPCRREDGTGEDEIAHVVSCPAAGVRVVDVTLGDGDDGLTITGLDYPSDLASYPPGPFPREACLLPPEAFVIARGDAGDDRLLGGRGNDRLDGGRGADYLSGGDGIDTGDFSQRTQPLTIGLNGVADDGEAGEGDNVQQDVEEVIGGSDGDRLIGSSAANCLDGRSGEDVIQGLGGADTVLGGVDDAGSDTLDGGGDNDTIRGGPGDDLLTGGTGEDNGRGGGGGDTLEGGPENDELAGGPGADRVDGEDGDDRLYGGDLILIGADGPDRLDGGPGADQLSGGESDQDTVTYEDRKSKVVVTLDGVANDGELNEHDNVLTDVEVILGGQVDDDLSGDAGDNTLEGGIGEDLLDGNLDFDRLLGGDEPDVVMARDGRADEVACGDGGDLAIADVGDRVKNCETVDRRGSRDAVVGRYALLTLLSFRREVLRLPQGRRFFPLAAQTVKIPIGSTIDPEGGVVRLTTASDRAGGRKLVSASGGRFTVRQRGGRRAVTRLRLLSGRLPDCRRASAQQGTANRAARRKLKIGEKGKGRVEVLGRYSIGASYGTKWITEERCDGTLTRVLSGTVVVRDLGRGRIVPVGPGERYLAKKP